MRPERTREAEEGIFPDGDAQAGAQEGAARQGTGGDWADSGLSCRRRSIW